METDGEIRTNGLLLWIAVSLASMAIYTASIGPVNALGLRLGKNPGWIWKPTETLYAPLDMVRRSLPEPMQSKVNAARQFYLMLWIDIVFWDGY